MASPKPIRACQPEIDAVHTDIFAERAAKRAAANSHTENGNGVTIALNLSDQDLLEKARAATNGTRFAALYDGGDWQGAGYPSQSEADVALCGTIAFYTGPDHGRIDRLFRTSALMREKWNRNDYRNRTIVKALEGRSEFYTANRSSERTWDDIRKGPSLGTGSPSPAVNRVELDAKAPYEIADVLLKSKFELEGVRTLHYYRGSFWQWSCGCFKQTDELPTAVGNYLHLEVSLTVPSRKKGPKIIPPAKWHKENVLDALKARAVLSSDTDPPAWLGIAPWGGPHLISCANGLLDLETLERHPHTPRFFITSTLAASYRKAADCSNWLEFLKTLWPKDQQSIDCLQEIFGYLLEADNWLQKLFMIIGPTRSGKGVIAKVLEAMLGIAAVATPSLSNFTQPFGLEKIIGRLVAIIADARLSRSADTDHALANILALSGGDNPSIDRKHRLAFVGPTSLCRIVILTNELPPFMDSSGALVARLVMLRTFESFLGREDPTLFVKKLRPELDGIFLWAITGWHRLRERGHFLTPESAEGLLESFGEQADRISGFMGDCVIFEPESVLEKDTVYNRYLEWARVHDQTVLQRNFFFRALGQRTGVDIDCRTNEITGTTYDPEGRKMPRRVKGIVLR